MKYIYPVIFYVCILSSCVKQEKCIGEIERAICMKIKKELIIANNEAFIRSRAGGAMYGSFQYYADSCEGVSRMQVNTILGFPEELYEFENLNELAILEGYVPDWNRFKGKELTRLHIQFMNNVKLYGAFLKNLKYLSIQLTGNLYVDKVIDKDIQVEEIELSAPKIDLSGRVFYKTKKMIIREYDVRCIKDIDFYFFPDLEILNISGGGGFLEGCDSLKTVYHVERIFKKHKKIQEIRYNSIMMKRNP